MSKLKEFKTVLEHSGLPQEEQDNLIENAEVFYDFNDYIKEKLDLSEEAVETLMSIKMNTAIKKIDFDSLESDDEIVEIIVNVLVDFAEQNNYPKCDKLRECAKIIISLQIK